MDLGKEVYITDLDLGDIENILTKSLENVVGKH